MIPKRGVIALITTACALVLLFTFKTPTSSRAIGSSVGGGPGTATVSAPAATGSATTTGDTTPTAVPTPGASTGTATSTPAARTATSTADKVITGTAVSFSYGTVQVQITVSGGTITDIATLQAPTDGHSGRISDYAVPILQSEALSAKSAKIDLVSGATYTSDAYVQSLQSALDQAGL